MEISEAELQSTAWLGREGRAGAKEDTVDSCFRPPKRVRNVSTDGYGTGPLENAGPQVRSTAILGICPCRRNALPPARREARERWTRRTIMAEAFELKDRFRPPQGAGSEEP